MGGARNAYNFFCKSEERGPFEDLGVNEKIIVNGMSVHQVQLDNTDLL
jgi:hypothetical protein